MVCSSVRCALLRLGFPFCAPVASRPRPVAFELVVALEEPVASDHWPPSGFPAGTRGWSGVELYPKVKGLAQPQLRSLSSRLTLSSRRLLGEAGLTAQAGCASAANCRW